MKCGCSCDRAEPGALIHLYWLQHSACGGYRTSCSVSSPCSQLQFVCLFVCSYSWEMKNRLIHGYWARFASCAFFEYVQLRSKWFAPNEIMKHFTKTLSNVCIIHKVLQSKTVIKVRAIIWYILTLKKTLQVCWITNVLKIVVVRIISLCVNYLREF